MASATGVVVIEEEVASNLKGAENEKALGGPGKAGGVQYSEKDTLSARSQNFKIRNHPAYCSRFIGTT
jgi:hypothetical protein